MSGRRAWLADLGALYGVQAAAYVAPLVTLPFLTRELGAEGWGRLAWAESLARTVGVVVEYGFQYSAARDVAGARDEGERARVVARVLAGQVLLAGLVAAVLVGWGGGRMVGWAALYGIGLGLSPAWYFQGRERARVYAGIEVAGRFLAAGLIVWKVRGAGGEEVALALWAGMAWLAAGVGFVVMKRELPAAEWSYRGGLAALRAGLPLALFRGAVNLYTGANALILGLFVPAAGVGAFAAAEKLARAAVSALAPWNQLAMPRVARLAGEGMEEARRVARVSLAGMTGLGLLAAAGIELLAPWLARKVLGAGFEAAVAPLRVLALLVPVVAVSNVLGLQWMVPLRKERAFTGVVAAAGLLNVGLAPVLAMRWGAAGMAAAVLGVESMVSLGLAAYLAWEGLLPWGVKTARPGNLVRGARAVQ